MKRPGIAVINFGGQYAPQIGKFVRGQNVWTEMVLPNEQHRLLREGYFENALGIIHSGSRHSVYSTNVPLPDSEILELQLPQFGYCYGQQAIQLVLGGEVVNTEGEFGVSTLHITDKSTIFRGLDDSESVLMSHRDVVVKPAPGHKRIGYTEKSPFAALMSLDGRLFGVQFHPEVYQTPKGNEIISNFLDICGAKREWNPRDYAEEKISRIRQEAGDSPVIVLASGGKDSTTAALLAKRALKPEQVYYLHVDTGLQRKDEASNARSMLERAGIDRRRLFVVDASSIFFEKLYGVTDDTQMRIIIGDTIFDIAEEFAREHGLRGYKFLQGTLTTDLVESSAITGLEDRIKVHHNVTERSRRYREIKLMIEPLDDFYKDDSKKLGPKVGTPQDVIEDEPMPGPGFAVRMGSLPFDFRYDRKSFVEIERKADEITLPHGLKSHVRPYYTVGVQGDERTIVHPAILEGDFDESTSREISKKLPDEIRKISRVWFLLEPRKIQSIEVIPGSFITRERVEQLREYEFVTKKVVKNLGFKGYTQFPLYLMPDRINDGGELVVLRPFYSLDYMTGISVWIPEEIRNSIVDAIHEVDDKSGRKRVSITEELEGKPPGTTEAY